jgi:hypothetical protein
MESKNASKSKAVLQTPPKHGFEESPIVALMYVESIPKVSYNQWLLEKSRKLSPTKPATSLDDMDSPMKKRHDIGYISENLESWTNRLSKKGTPIIPSFAQVQAATDATVAIAVDYDRDGLTWRSDYRIVISHDSKNNVWKNLVVHLPNDGFFYVDESLLPVLAGGRRNVRHMNTCSEGWAYLDQCLWPKLERFEKFAREWYGYNDTQKLQRQILYNDTSNRMDISLRCPATSVGIDFVFEPGFPVPVVPDEFWF